MNRSELRYGNLFNPMDRHNYIHMPNTIAVLKVLTIGFSEVEALLYDKNEAQNVPFKVKMFDMCPIEITEEWLMKFGFLRNTSLGYSDGYLGKEGVRFNFTIASPKTLGEWQNDYVFTKIKNVHIPIKYVHDLQNLYFALTGVELVFSS